MSARTCLLCGSEALNSVFEIKGKDIRRLYAERGLQLSDQAFGVISPEYVVSLSRCAHCGFEFFDPQLSGSGMFYSELERASYYPVKRPEFLRAMETAKESALRSVLDIGCGTGDFLDLARANGMTTYGLELNSTAANAARERGHTVFLKRLEELSASDFAGGVDMATLFQVVEHVPGPVSFLSAVKPLVRPGGAIVVSVPNRKGLGRLFPLDPANMPPHHISRWRHEDLSRLARSCNLEVTHRGGDILYGRGIEEFWRSQRRAASAIGRPVKAIPRWLPGFVSLMYRKLGLRFLMPRWGMSIYAVMRSQATK